MLPAYSDEFKVISQATGKHKSKCLSPCIPSIRPLPCLFALLIGIDRYKKKDIARLEAAVADVDKVKKYLMKYLSVPGTRITTLVNEAATRIAIIDAIQNLSKDVNIRAGDAILIYFAGHGARVTAPGAWTEMTQHIEVIVPYDMGVDNIPSIPDRTLGALLINLSRAKGDNITVILDSCHSGSGTRNVKNGISFINRGIEITDSILPDLDRNIWGEIELSLPVSERGSVVTGGFAHPGETSHVLLAACQPGEQAREMPLKKYGVFTNALLEALEMYDIQNLTYANLLKKMKSLNNQHPQCEGRNKNRLIFNANPPPPWAFEHDVKRCGNRYILRAGKVHSIVNGAKFHVYRNQDQSSYAVDAHPVVMIAKNVKENMADLLPMGSTDELAGPSWLVAIQTSAGPDEALLVYASPEGRMYSMLQQMIEQAKQADRPWRIRLVD